MTFPALAVAVGFAIALARGGRLRYVGPNPFRLWALVPVGVAAQAIADLVPPLPGQLLLVGSYAILLGFAIANLTVAGMGLVVVGISLNMAVVTLNGGMPVRPDAIVAAGIADWDELDELDLGAKRHLERPDEQLMVLGDIIPVPGARSVLSFGDLIMSAGTAAVTVHLLRPPCARARRRGSAEGPDMTAATAGGIPSGGAGRR